MTGLQAICPLLTLVVGCLLITACSGTPAVTINTAAGQTPLFAPAPATRSGLTRPPSYVAPTPPPIGDRNGSYAGTAQPLNTGGGLCISSRRVTGFRVRENSVCFGNFHGTIDANGGVQMAHGQQWLVGQFEGAIFYGQLDIPGISRSAPQGCSYILSLERVGP